MRNYTSVNSESLKESSQLSDLELDERIALELLSKNMARNVGLDSAETRQSPVVDVIENMNEHSLGRLDKLNVIKFRRKNGQRQTAETRPQTSRKKRSWTA